MLEVPELERPDEVAISISFESFVSPSRFQGEYFHRWDLDFNYSLETIGRYSGSIIIHSVRRQTILNSLISSCGVSCPWLADPTPLCPRDDDAGKKRI